MSQNAVKPGSNRYMALEVEWYLANGNHGWDRIARGWSGHYVIGDWSWNRSHPESHESIESQMRQALLPYTQGVVNK